MRLDPFAANTRDDGFVVDHIGFIVGQRVFKLFEEYFVEISNGRVRRRCRSGVGFRGIRGLRSRQSDALQTAADEARFGLDGRGGGRGVSGLDDVKTFHFRPLLLGFGVFVMGRDGS